MRRLFGWFVILLVLGTIAAATAYYLAGKGPPPALAIVKPDRVVGQTGSLDVTADAPGGKLTSLTIAVEQNGRSVPLFSLDNPLASGGLAAEGPDRLRVTRAFGKQNVPALQSGHARIVVSATRSVFFDLRTLSSSTTKDFVVQLEPPRLAVVSTHHYVNHGGSEMVIYRVTPPDVAMSGVRVGSVEYSGYPAAGAGVASADPSLKVAFFALLHEQDLAAPIAVFARDDAGNEAKAAFVDNVFQKPFRRSRIEVDDRFFQRVVPPIVEHSPELNLGPAGSSTSSPPPDLLASFLKVNGELRKLNAERIVAIASNSSPTRLWEGPFSQLGNSQVEAGFADHRTYIHAGNEINQQVHLGFDLAVTANVPVLAANTGTVLHAAWLGIYGNCVIVDHGMGVASLYGHLSSFEVKAGDHVTKGQVLGKSGMTGLAGGDHLHFTVLVGGRPVNPVEWWDAHWVEDRVTRKLKEAAQ